MLEKFIFENHLGQRFIGDENGVYMQTSDLRNYSWSNETINSRISRFYRPTDSRKIALAVVGKTDDEAVTIKNHLLDMAEPDIEAVKPGKVYIGEWYTNGYITASNKSNHLFTKKACTNELTLTRDDSAWYREETTVFFPHSGGTVGTEGGFDYPHDFKYDFAAYLTGRKIMCNAVSASAFRLLIYGEITNPTVNIGGNSYSVNCTVGAGETLLIDGLNKTITLTTADGVQKNMFDSRGRENYIFTPLPAGSNTVSWTGTFGFDLTVIEKRSEPKWT